MKNNQKGIISSSSVDEEMRIRFTSQLHQLRESEVKEVIFPSNLNNIVKFTSFPSFLLLSFFYFFLILFYLLGKKISS